MSARSPVTTVPPGSAIATTRASTAEPVRARRLSSAARRAVDSLTDGSMMHIFRNRWVLASLQSPVADSTSTIVGTTGGHKSCALNARMSDRAVLVRAERRNNPPLSSTSTDQPTRSSDRSRIRRTIASAVACWRWLGSPTSAASSARYRSASASASWRSSSARSATCSSSEAGGRVASVARGDRRAGTPERRGIRLTIRIIPRRVSAHINDPTQATRPSEIGTTVSDHPPENVGSVHTDEPLCHVVSGSAMCRPCRSAASHSARSTLVRTAAPTKTAAARWTAS